MELAFLFSCFDPAKERTGQPSQQRSMVIHLLLGVVKCAMVQSKLTVPGRPTNRLEQGKGLLRMQ